VRFSLLVYLTARYAYLTKDIKKSNKKKARPHCERAPLVGRGGFEA